MHGVGRGSIPRRSTNLRIDMNVDLTEQMKAAFADVIGEQVTPEVLEGLRQDVLHGVFKYIDVNSECVYDTNTGSVTVNLPILPPGIVLKTETEISI